MENNTDAGQDVALSAYICLGSNVGNSREILAKAIANIDGADGLSVQDKSLIYRTEPQGLKDQDWFYNQVIRVEFTSNWTAHALMDFLLKVEEIHGRDRTKAVQNAPRTLDLDILLFGQETGTDAHCILPHENMFVRAFVLVPLREIIAPQALNFLQKGHSHDYIDSKLMKLAYTVQEDKIFQL